MLDRTTTIRAGAAIVRVSKFDFLVIGHVHLNRFGDSIGTRGYAVLAKASRFVAGDTDHLLDSLTCLYA